MKSETWHDGPGRSQLMGAVWGCLVLVLAISSGCQRMGYYHHVIGGHLALMSGRERIGEVIDDPGTEPERRNRLQMILKIRDFASEGLCLPKNDSYRSYVQLERSHVVWVVFAAPEFSLQPETWSFPFAGRVPYRSYYEPEKARKFAASLRHQGMDVCVLGVPAYSTLGWFDDPVPSTVLDFPEPDLAGLIFHELAHQTVYVEGDSAFNESFAVTVELEGIERWMKSRGEEKKYRQYEERRRREEQFLKMMRRSRERLSELYSSTISADTMRIEKQRILDRVRREVVKLTAESGEEGIWDEVKVNNALIAALSTYHRHVPAFKKLLERVGGDMDAFFARVRQMAEMCPEERKAKLKELAHVEK